MPHHRFATFRPALLALLAGSVLLAYAALPVRAATMVVRGSMDSLIDFSMEKTIQSADVTNTFYLSFVEPKTSQSPTFGQEVRDFRLAFDPTPNNRKTYTDKRGNEVLEFRWDKPPRTIKAQVSFKAANTTTLHTLQSDAPFPMQSINGEPAEYLAGSEQVQKDDARIVALAATLTTGADTEFEAVQRISEWVVDNVRYVNPSERHDALYSFESGKGNCQNYSHLAAALMRASGIPVRIVNGFTLDEPFDVTLISGVVRSRMGLGRHSWIEVWFPDLGWAPFNPQNTAMFVANRFIRVEVGLDNKETVSDGKIRWVVGDRSRRPSVQENITSDFGRDTVSLAGQEEQSGPRQRLMRPEVHSEVAVRTPTPVKPVPAAPTPAARPTEPKPEQKPTQQPVTKPGVRPQQQPSPKPSPKPTPEPARNATALLPKVPTGSQLVYGNLEFPENVDFATYAEAPTGTGNVLTLTRNFMVETAEYVTTHLRQYAQTFEVTHPMALRDISLALHRYGGEGMLWLDLMRDAGGKPGDLIATSEFVPVDSISLRPGYRWASFAFASSEAQLAPGRYWIGLGYTGDPILNWYYTYGKPVGPPDGTRFRDALVSDWGGALNYEFNYRIRGTAR